MTKPSKELQAKKMKPSGIKTFIPGIAWFFVVLVLLCLPGKDIPGATWLDKIYFDKWVHAGIFGLLAFLFMLPFADIESDPSAKFQVFVKIAIITSIWGLSTEFIQKYLVTGRSFDLMDWAADSIGAMLALLFAKKRYT